MSVGRVLSFVVLGLRNSRGETCIFSQNTGEPKKSLGDRRLWC